jgi:predicted permease
LTGAGLCATGFADMSEFQTVLGAVLPVFGIVGVGLLIRKLNWLTAEADASLLRVNINLLLPCLIFDATLGNPALAQWRNLLLGPVVGFGTVALGMAVALAARPLHGLTDRRAARTFAMTTSIYNYKFIPLPLAMLLFDKATVAVLFVMVVGIETALWTLGVLLLSPAGVGANWRQIFNPPLLAIGLSLLLNTLGGDACVPKVLITGAHWLGQCAIPTALLLVGAMLADDLRGFHSRSAWRVIGAATLLRVGVLPLLFLLLAKHLPATPELKRVIVLQAAMPAAIFPIAMARHYGGDPVTAMRVVFSTSLVGLVTIPLWIRFGLQFVGL